MKKGKTILSESEKNVKSTLSQDEIKRAALYNYSNMQMETIEAKAGFAKRLAFLRSARGVSAREMSLSLGEGPGYISNIENGYSKPSVDMFFEICEYLDVTPAMFFDYTLRRPDETGALLDLLNELESDDADLLIKLAGKLVRQKKTRV